MSFSNRTAWELEENDFAIAVRAYRAAGGAIIDLTASNPTRCGFRYAEALLAPLADPAAAAYEPAAFGMEHSRQAVAGYYRELGCKLFPESICLTTSTSEAYSFLFRLLCDPGDDVLIARPSYPLFEYIARLDGVVLQEYPLHYDPASEEWWIDFDALRAAITPRTRAIIVVHPNNPTGSYVHLRERQELLALCAERKLALIADEVFLDYALEEREDSFAAAESPALTFTLSGLSKVCGLPQMKASWIVTTGPAELVREALARLEIIADTFLSMSAPVQFALTRWLPERALLQQQIKERMESNLAALKDRLRGTHSSMLRVEGGWTVILQVPREVDYQAFAFASLQNGVLVQPGDFYSMGPARIVLSLLTPPDDWQRGLALLPLSSE
ncbi:MAG: pyridoxal phosphate-dependent aminotransferase [Acidobacteriaceae bacterium]|nr:pyridoxal phosphate-dependent aminotransferase [Acidobacteriaceae bacterium]